MSPSVRSTEPVDPLPILSNSEVTSPFALSILFASVLTLPTRFCVSPVTAVIVLSAMSDTLLLNVLL